MDADDVELDALKEIVAGWTPPDGEMVNSAVTVLGPTTMIVEPEPLAPELSLATAVAVYVPLDAYTC